MSYNALRGYENKVCAGVGTGLPMMYEGVYGKQILEVGFGEGKLLKQLVKQGNKCYGIDVSKLAIIMAEESGLNANLIQLDVSFNRFPYQDGHFDVVYLYNTLEYLENPLHCICEIKRVLKDNGLLYLCFDEGQISAYPGFMFLDNIMRFIQQLYFKVDKEDIIEENGVQYIQAVNQKVDRMEILDVLHNEVDYSELYGDM